MITLPQLHSFISGELNIDPRECDDDGAAMEISEIAMTRDTFEDAMMIFMFDNQVELDLDDIKYRTDEMDDSGLEILIVRVPYTSAHPS